MNLLKFSRLLISIHLLLFVLTGCAGNIASAASTPTVIPPTTTATTAPTLSVTSEVEAAPGAPGLGDSLYPHLGNSGYDVQHYTLDLMVRDVSTSELEGVTIIEAQATQNLSSFNFDFIGFEITDITVNGQSAEFARSQQELTIIPSAALEKGESFTVEVRYQGVPGEVNSIAIPVQTGWITFDGGSFVLSEPDGAATFFPVNDHPLDKASYTFRVTVPKPFEVAANGVLTETIDSAERTTFIFEAREPMASYLATVNIDEFDVETSQSENGIPIRNYYPSDLPKNMRTPFASQGEMIDYFSELFGAYPFEVYGAAVIDAEFGVALETQTLSIFGLQMVDPNYPEGTQQVIAHELAHQWFGDSVSLADWRDIWLNESFATYSQGLWTEHTEGRAALDRWIRELYAFVRDAQTSLRPPGEPSADNLFSPSVYYWGALALHALRLEVGDEVFFQVLKTYYEEHEGDNVTTADFISVAEDVSGQDLTSFFDRWLYSEELAPIPAMGLEPN